MKKLKIYVFLNKEKDYLQLQIDSYKEFMDDGNTEFIVVNGAQNKGHRDLINDICEKSSIETIQYHDANNTTYRWYGGAQMHWFVQNIQPTINDYIMFIHPDMFFVNTLDYKKIMAEKELYFIPRYHQGFFYMWEGVILFNSEFINENNLTKQFDLSGYYVKNGIRTDGGGKTQHMLENMNPDDYGFFEFWNIGDINGDEMDTHLNGHVRYTFNINSDSIHLTSPGKPKPGPMMGDKSFPYEEGREDYEKYYIDRFKTIKKRYVDGYDYPKPIHIDLINVHNDFDEYFLLHFKSGTLYQKHQNEHYRDIKMEVLNKVLKDKFKK
jgi:hypothetical protein